MARRGQQPVATKPVAKPQEKKKSQKVERYLSEEELQDLRETFDLFDDDRSGTIDAHEIKKVLEDLGLDSRNPIIFKMVQDLENYGGPIDFDTFVDIISERLGNNKSRNGAEKLFAIYDPEGTGFIDFPKLKAVAKELGETLNDEELKEMIHHIHIIRKTDEPDQINFEEFYEIITAPRRY